MRTRENVLKEFGLLQRDNNVWEDHGDGVSSRHAPSSAVLAMADRIAALEARAEAGVTEAMVERAREAYRNAWWVEDGNADGNPFTMDARNRIWRAALEAAFTGGASDAH